MKNPRSHRSGAAFTLIELLVVISIIAILASLTFTGVASAMVSAKKVSARSDMSQIATAVQLYYAEYGKYPVLSATTDTAFGVGNTGNDQVVSVLRYQAVGSIITQSVLDNSMNTRQIKFLQPKVMTTGTTTATKGAVNFSTGKWYDPWGTQFIIFIDGDYGGDINPAAAFTDAVFTTKPSVSVGVASVGYYYTKKNLTQVDALPSAGRAYDKSADLLSWQ